MKCDAKSSRGRQRKFAAFTLIELLVVVGIIAVLIAILMPSLGAARRQAKTVLCAANLSGLAKTMRFYAADWDGSILGNGRTSNVGLLAKPQDEQITLAPGVSDSFMPYGIINPGDWMTGMARQMGKVFDQGTDNNSRANRFHQLAGGKSSKTGLDTGGIKNFKCPENDVKATAYGLTQVNPHPMISYITALGFQTRYSGSYGGSGSVSNPERSFQQNFVQIPAGYRNNLQQVGQESTKAFMADGARWWDGGAGTGVTTTLSMGTSSAGGTSSDWGPWDHFNRAYIYTSATVDNRSAGMRHGGQSSKSAPYAAHKMNVAFFDAHVETMNGKDASNPFIWFPKDTIIPFGEALTSADPGFNEITKLYFPGSSNIVAP